MALYRKYRPATFQEVVGQEHVTGPLSVALDSGRINHAYLFSGPRGCGKTSSARILARSLNCEHGPTSTPCGVCNSCRSLAPGGPGNLDVTELDAASHNGVEDMRELRDRAFYAPAESRYRVFIIDEAHMITSAGSNALLKIVEEPPEHLVFIFATTEPEKVIGTIRSRTHHYPFRLLTPQTMRGLLQRTVAAEGVHVDDAVYPLIIRAGGGSPRDSLSVLDQLLAGAGPEGLTYDMAVPLLGVTDASLIDAAIDALAAGDAGGLYTTVNQVIEAGHDPRRFTQDLLDRLRDLMILEVVPEAIESGLVDAPADHVSTLQQEATAFGSGQIARLASLVNDGLDEMRGATSPRLLLEILCARMLLPGAGLGGGIGASVAPAAPTSAGPGNRSGLRGAAAARQAISDAAARRAAAAGGAAKSQPTPEAQRQPEPAASTTPQQSRQPEPGADAGVQPGAQQRVAQQPGAAAQRPHERQEPQRGEQPQAKPQPEPQERSQQETQPEPQRSERPRTADEPRDQAARAHAKWGELMAAITKQNATTAILLTGARVLGVRDGVLVLGHHTGALASRLSAPEHKQLVLNALHEVLGLDLDVRFEVGTNPRKAGFEPLDEPKPAPTWNPSREQSAEAEPEPAKDEQEASAEAEPGIQTAPAPEPERKEGEASEPPAAPTAPDVEPESQDDVEAQAEVAESTEDTTAAEDQVQETAGPGPQAPEAVRPQASAQAAPTSVWGEPAKLGGAEPETAAPQAPSPAQEQQVRPQARPQPRSQPQPPSAPRPQRGSTASQDSAGEERKPRRWELMRKAAHQNPNSADAVSVPHMPSTSFSNGVPLPPEPEEFGYEGGAPEFEEEQVPAPSRSPESGRSPEQVRAPEPVRPDARPQQAAPPNPDPAPAPEQPAREGAGGVEKHDAHTPDEESEEEQEMREAAAQPKNWDHRDAKAIAMELLEAELGARPL